MKYDIVEDDIKIGNKIIYGIDKDILDIIHSLEKENQELKKRLEERPKEYVFIGNAQNKTRDFINQITKDNKEFKTQQKEFINWLENGIEKVKNTEFLDERIQRAGLIAYNRCLQKYKSIIGDE